MRAALPANWRGNVWSSFFSSRLIASHCLTTNRRRAVRPTRPPLQQKRADAADQFLAHSSRDFVDIETARLPRRSGRASRLAEANRPVLRADSRRRLHAPPPRLRRLLRSAETQRCVVLLAVPWAAAGRAQPRDDIAELGRSSALIVRSSIAAGSSISINSRLSTINFFKSARATDGCRTRRFRRTSSCPHKS